MTLKAAKQAAAVVAPAPVAVRRIYMDITGHVDAALEGIAKSKGISKKAMVEGLILAAVQPKDLTIKSKK